jgi:hypothetical protein
MILTKCLSAERFEIPSERAQKGLLCAVKLLEWMKKKRRVSWLSLSKNAVHLKRQ